MLANTMASHAVKTRTKKQLTLIIGLPIIVLEPTKTTKKHNQTVSEKKKNLFKSVVDPKAIKYTPVNNIYQNTRDCSISTMILGRAAGRNRGSLVHI